VSLIKYEVFNAVIEYGSLTKAAEALNLTQSAISYSISNLESELGFSLLIRHRSGVSLTSDGERILKYIRAILHAEEKMKQEAASITGLEVGTIRIGAFTSVCIKWLPGLMKRFKQDHPSIEIKILQGGYRDIEQWITNGSIDFGFVSLPTAESFTITPLKEDRLVCIVPSNHPLSNKGRIRFEQLEEESFIVQKSGYDNDINRLFKETGITLKNKFEMSDDQAIIAMVENNLGVSIIPELVLQGLSPKCSILRLEPEQYRTIAIATPNSTEISPVSKKFIEYVKTELR